MGRCLLIAEYFISVKNKDGNGKETSETYPIYIATSHFESLEGPSKRMRKD